MFSLTIWPLQWCLLPMRRETLCFSYLGDISDIRYQIYQISDNILILTKIFPLQLLFADVLFCSLEEHRTLHFTWKLEILKITIMFPLSVFCPRLTVTSNFPCEIVCRIQLFCVWLYLNNYFKSQTHTIFTFYKISF